MSTATSGWTIDAIKRAACWKSLVSVMAGDVRVASKVHEGPGGIYVVISRKRDEYDVRTYHVNRFDPRSYWLTPAGNHEGYPSSSVAHSKAERFASSL